MTLLIVGAFLLWAALVALCPLFLSIAKDREDR